MPIPKDEVELTRFLGMVTYLSRFVPNLSDKANELRKLTSGKDEWAWTEKHQHDFDQLKTALTSTPVLKYFDVKKPVTIQADRCIRFCSGSVHHARRSADFIRFKGAHQNPAKLRTNRERIARSSICVSTI